MIIGRPTFNQLDAILYTLYLCMKYSLSNGRVRVIQGNRDISRKCYVESLKLKRVCTLCARASRIGLGIKPLGETYKGEEASPLIAEEIED